MIVRKELYLLIPALIGTGSVNVAIAADAPSVEELWETVQQQQQEIEQLREELESNRNQTSSVQVRSLENSELIEAVGDVIESSDGLLASADSRTTRIGGYGEMIYNNETSSSSSKELDVQRFVLFVGHQFNDSLRFHSELEIEHSFISDDDRSPGAVELEQAYVEWDYSANHSVLAGMHLVPMGIINETHEPATFYGVERNRIESRIIPSTYRVNGIKFSGRLGGGFSYDLGVHEGLFFESGNGGELAIRDSRQSGARAEMDDPAYTGRLRYTGVPGLELGVSMQYQSDMTQSGSSRSNIGREGVLDVFGNPVDDISGVLSEAHVVYRTGPWGFRALYAQWDIDSNIETVANNDLSNNGLGRDKQYGYYFEPSYQINEKLGAFIRIERTDERAGSSLAEANDTRTDRTLLGLNYWLSNNTVLKLDYQFENDDKDRGLNGFNAGIGWQF